MPGVLKQNISYAIRTLLKHKGFTITAVLTLALGIGFPALRASRVEPLVALRYE